MAKQYDAIIIGGVATEATCAAYLAKAGKKCFPVLERRHVLGGAAVTEEIYPGFKYTVCSYVVSLLRPWIIRDLELAKHGLQIMPLETSFTPYLDGTSLVRWLRLESFKRGDCSDSPHTMRSCIPNSVKRSLNYLNSQSQSLMRHHPTLHPPISSDLLSLLRIGNSFNSLPKDLAELEVKLMTMSAADFLDEWFESDKLQGTYVLQRHHRNSWVSVRQVLHTSFYITTWVKLMARSGLGDFVRAAMALFQRQ